MSQLFAFFYGIPFVLTKMNSTFGMTFHPDMVSPLTVALITFSLHSAAHLTEVVRSALLAVDRGQLEAAKIVGMTTRQAMIRIILPQAFVVALPNLGTQLIQRLKATSLSFYNWCTEIMGISRIIANDGYKFLETYLVSALIYWMLSIFFELAFAIFEKKIERAEDLFDDKKVEQARAPDRLFSFIYSLFFGGWLSFGAGFSFGAEPNTTGAEIYLNSPFPSMLRPCAHLPSLLSSPLEKLNRS